MSNIIVLPKNITDLIAAGEVVERPASVMKELLENSIDAGANKITAEIMNGGIKFLRVTDNGSGIYRDDIRNAFVSHATSKIKTADDLNGIFTLGFRGEALASVAAVAKIDVLTKPAESEIGLHYCIEGSEELLFEDAGCPDGTTIVVNDLFFNTPARMKFLKKDVSEGNAVMGVVEKIALSHPEVSFRFIRDGKQVLMTSGNGDLLSAVYSVLGKDISLAMIPVSYEMDGVTVTGLISKPSACRATRGMQYFYLNSRYIKSSTVTAALEQAYKNAMMVGKFPACVLNVNVNVSDVDVNVHPTKTEVRFSDERKIFSAVYYACLSAVNTLDTRIRADLAKPAKKNFDQAQKHYSQLVMEKRPKKDFWQNLTGEEFRGVSAIMSDSAAEKRVPIHKDEKESLLDDYYRKKSEEAAFVPQNDVKPEQQADCEAEIEFVPQEETKPDVKVVGEAFNTYIIAERGSKLYIIDKHAAHERILFNKIKENKMSSQYLFTPIAVKLSKSEYDAVLENLDLLTKAGYTAEDFGSGTVLIRECPGGIEASDIPGQIEEIAGYLLLNKNNIETEKIDWIYHSAACRAAVKAGDITTEYERQKFAEALLDDESIRYCPHGRPVLVEITKADIEKMFGRRQ